MTIRSSPCYLLMAVGSAGIAIISIAVLLTPLPTLLWRRVAAQGSE